MAEGKSEESGVSLDSIKPLQVTKQLGIAIVAAEEYKKNLEDYASEILSSVKAKVKEAKKYIDEQQELFGLSQEQLIEQLKAEGSKEVSDLGERIERDYERAAGELNERLRKLEEELGKLRGFDELNERLKDLISKSNLDAFERRFYNRVDGDFLRKGDVERDYVSKADFDNWKRRVVELDARLQVRVEETIQPGNYSSEKPDDLLSSDSGVSVNPDTQYEDSKPDKPDSPE